jgi:hypothetical protein
MTEKNMDRQQSPEKILDRILNYPHKEKGCSYICGPHLDPCVLVRYHDHDCACSKCDVVVNFRAKVAAHKRETGGETR